MTFRETSPDYLDRIIVLEEQLKIKEKKKDEEELPEFVRIPCKGQEYGLIKRESIEMIRHVEYEMKFTLKGGVVFMLGQCWFAYYEEWFQKYLLSKYGQKMLEKIGFRFPKEVYDEDEDEESDAIPSDDSSQKE